MSLNLFIVVIVVIVAALAHLLLRGNFSITHDQQQLENLSHTKLKYAFSWSKCSSFEFIELINYELFIEIISCECGIYELIAKSLGLMFLFVIHIHILIFLALTFLWMLIKLFLYCRRAAGNVVPMKMNPVKSMTTSRLHTSTFRCSRCPFSLSLSLRVFLSGRTIRSVVDF